MGPHLCSVDENLDKLLYPRGRLQHRILLQKSYPRVSNTRQEDAGEPTASERHSLGVVFSNIVLNPRPVRIALAARPLIVAQHLGDGKVAQQTRRYGDLQGEPVLSLADVEDVASVRGACFGRVRIGRAAGLGKTDLGAPRWIASLRGRC